jgi:uncharacterized peroxidase-related enzyme
MSRISRLGLSQVSGAARDSYERKIAERGNVPNMYRVFAHRPWLLTTMDAHLSAVMGSGTVPLRTKELLALQTSLANACDYGTASETALAERTGATRQQIAAALDFENGPFEEKEKAALRFGLEMTRNANEISEETFRELSTYFDEGEILEIAAVVGLFNYFNRINEALAVEPTQPGEGVDS